MIRDEVIKEIRRRCRIFDVKFDMRRGTSVFLDKENNSRCSGYFDAYDERGPRLVVAGGLEDDDKFLGTLIHEYCHVTQWVENCTIWREDEKCGNRYNIWGWLGSNRACSDGMRRAFELRRDLEADNERRAVRLIKELKIDLDLGTYIQAANSYIHFYNTMPETNRWYHPKRVPYKSPDILKLFRSDKIDDDFSHTSKKRFKALMKCADV